MGQKLSQPQKGRSKLLNLPHGEQDYQSTCLKGYIIYMYTQ